MLTSHWGDMAKTPNGNYVLSPKDPKFFDEDLSGLVSVVVLNKTGATILTGSIRLITAPLG